MYGVYRIVNTRTGDFYIGSTTRAFEDRAEEHFRALRGGYHYNPHLQSAFDLYGPDAFLFEVVEQVDDPEQILAREQFYLDALNPHYNIARVAGSPMKGRTLPAEARRRISEASREFANDPAERERRRERMLRWAAKPENRERISETSRRSWDDPEVREARTRGSRDYWADPKSRDRQSKIASDYWANPDAKQRASRIVASQWADPEIRRKRVAGLSKSWPGVVAPDGTVYPIIVNLRQFCRDHGLHMSCMQRMFAGELKQHKGWTVLKETNQ